MSAGTSYTLTLTNHDDNVVGDATYTLFDDVALTPVVVNDFSMGASPNTVTVDRGASGESTISTVAIGSAGTVALSVSGLPAGSTATLAPGMSVIGTGVPGTGQAADAEGFAVENAFLFPRRSTRNRIAGALDRRLAVTA